MNINGKKGYILYFDDCRSRKLLTDEQRGKVDRVSSDFAEAVAENLELGEHIEELHPELDTASRISFFHSAQSTYRDTIKWHDKQERCRNAAEKRWRRLSELSEGISRGFSDGFSEDDEPEECLL